MKKSVKSTFYANSKHGKQPITNYQLRNFTKIRVTLNLVPCFFTYILNQRGLRMNNVVRVLLCTSLAVVFGCLEADLKYLILLGFTLESFESLLESFGVLCQAVSRQAYHPEWYFLARIDPCSQRQSCLSWFRSSETFFLPSSAQAPASARLS